jgi:hypothetical protein
MSELVTSTEAKKRYGLTDSLIRKLGEPDKTSPNPRYREAAPIRLYEVARVEAFVNENREAIAASNVRSKRSKSVANIRSEQLIEQARVLPIVIESPKGGVLKAAIASYNDLWQSRGELQKFASKDSPREFLNRITVNYLRHQCSHYEKWLEKFVKVPGAIEARALIRQRVIDAIAHKYPHLKDECAEQNADLEEKEIDLS